MTRKYYCQRSVPATANVRNLELSNHTKLEGTRQVRDVVRHVTYGLNIEELTQRTEIQLQIVPKDGSATVATTEYAENPETTNTRQR